MYAIFPLRHTWISQEMNGSYSHKETKAIDFGSLKAYRDYTLYAPFDGHVVFADVLSKGGAIAFESDLPVVFADGTTDYMTVITAHDNNRPEVGSVFKRGQVYGHMGTAGGVGKHCHLEVQKGKFVKYSSYTSQGYYKWPNTVNPYDALFLTADTFIDDAPSVAHYSWRILYMDKDKEIEELKEENEKLKAAYNGLLEKYDEQTKKLNDMTTLKKKYQSANKKKIEIINQVRDLVTEIGRMLNDLTGVLKL